MKCLPPVSTSLKWSILFLCLLTACDQLRNTASEAELPRTLPTVSIDVREVQTAIRERLSTAGSDVSCLQDTLHNDSVLNRQLRELYRKGDCLPLWLDEKGISPVAEAYLAQLADLSADGLNPQDYDLFLADKEFEKFRSGKTLTAAEWGQFDCCMSLSFFKVSNDLVMGRYYALNRNYKDWLNSNDSSFNAVEALQKSLLAKDWKEAFHFMRPRHPWYETFRAEYKRLDSLTAVDQQAEITGLKDSLAIGFSSPEIATLRRRLQLDMNLPFDTNLAVCDQALIDLIKAFQYRQQLKVSGKLDTATLHRLNRSVASRQKMLALNMERLRWLQHDFPQPYIWSVTPRMEVEYIEKDSVQFRMRTVVGRPSRPTPTLNTKLETIVMSPPWVVPPTILREDVLPGIARRGGAYLARKGLRAYDRRGRPVSASAINASNFRSFSISQAPGYSSSLGEVKFNMPNAMSVYMHDTPHREDFVKYYRALSSGCVRVHKPKEFAAFLLRDSLNYSYQKIDSICKLRKTIFVPMKRTIQVHLVYLTNAVDSNGHILYLKDIYNWDGKVKGLH